MKSDNEVLSDVDMPQAGSDYFTDMELDEQNDSDVGNFDNAEDIADMSIIQFNGENPDNANQNHLVNGENNASEASASNETDSSEASSGDETDSSEASSGDETDSSEASDSDEHDSPAANSNDENDAAGADDSNENNQFDDMSIVHLTFDAVDNADQNGSMSNDDSDNSSEPNSIAEDEDELSESVDDDSSDLSTLARDEDGNTLSDISSVYASSDPSFSDDEEFNIGEAQPGYILQNLGFFSPPGTPPQQPANPANSNDFFGFNI